MTLWVNHVILGVLADVGSPPNNDQTGKRPGLRHHPLSRMMAAEVFVPYKGGAAGLTDVLGGQVDLFVTATSIVTPFIRAGKLKPLTVMSEERVLQLPDIPTARESGYDVVAYFWTGVVAPAGTPPAIVAKLNSEVNKVLVKPELRNVILNLSAQPKGGTPETFAKLIAAEVPRADFDRVESVFPGMFR